MEVASGGEGDKSKTDTGSFTSVHRSVLRTDMRHWCMHARQKLGTFLS